MISHGDRAPAFRLPSVGAEDGGIRRLRTALESGTVLLLFCPRRLLEGGRVRRGPLAYAPWFQFEDGVQVWVLAEGPRRWDREPGGDLLPGVTVLSDPSGDVADEYGVTGPTGSTDASPSTAVVLVDSEGTVRFAHPPDAPFDRHRVVELRRELTRIARTYTLEGAA